MEELDALLTLEQPFGPNASEYIGDEVFGAILDESNSSFAALKTRPFLIIGRRGSGKTSILKAIKNSERFDIVAEIPTDASIQEIIDRIDTGESGNKITETIYRVWEKLLWTMVFSEFVKRYKTKYPADAALAYNYLQTIGVEEGSLPRQIIELIVRLFKGRSETADYALDALNVILDAKSTFDGVRARVIEDLKAEKARAVILIDNVEQIDMEDKASSMAISGLLMAIDSFKNTSVPVEVRCCIPAEIYPRLIRIAANTDKSFSSKVVLHWTSAELVHLAMLRYKKFLKMHAPEAVYGPVRSLDLSDKADLSQFIDRFFPRTITNGLGVDEATLRYILRHTQLLPRQFISYLNQIANYAFQRKPGEFYFDEASIVSAISEAEHLTCSGVFNGYKMIFPNAEAVCEAMLPELGLFFEYGDFERVFRQAQRALPYFETPNECLKLLTEIGAIGVIEGEDGQYYRAEFSYNLPQDLATKHSDTLCVHPAFSGRYRCRIDGQAYHPIFPKGSEAEDFV